MNSRPTYHQLEALADFLGENPGIAKGLLRSAHGKFDTKRKWDELSAILNALGGAQKDGKGWAKYWADKKCTLKKMCAQHAQSLNRTGGGVADEIPSLTPIDQRLVAVMGGPQFAAGDTHVAVNPFPSTMASRDSYEEQQKRLQDLFDAASTPYDVYVYKRTDISYMCSTMRCATTPIGNSQIQDVPSQDVEIEVLTQGDMVPLASPMQVAETATFVTRPPSPQRQRSPLRRSPRSNQRQRTRAGRTVLDQDRETFAEIEAKRVEAETLTARALSQAVEQLTNVSTAIEGLSAATRESCQAVADALNRIAAALRPE